MVRYVRLTSICLCRQQYDTVYKSIFSSSVYEAWHLYNEIVLDQYLLDQFEEDPHWKCEKDMSQST